MKVHLMYADRDPASVDDPPPITDDPAPAQDLTQDLLRDLSLGPVLDQMGGGDDEVRRVAIHSLLTPLHSVEEVRYRHAVLADFLNHPIMAGRLHELARQAVDAPRRSRAWLIGKDPGAVLHRAVGVLELLLTDLRTLRALADEYGSSCSSPGLQTFFAGIHTELPDDYFPLVEDHLRRLKFPTGTYMTAHLGSGGHGDDYVLRRPADVRHPWVHALLGSEPVSYTYQLPDRDEAGAVALAALENRGINLVADAVAQSVDHICSFFRLLAYETGFYLGAVNLHRALAQHGLPWCWPEPSTGQAPVLTVRGLYDISLGLRIGGRIVGNDLDADGATLVLITGANQGGKSTTLRALGVAQLLLQAGLQVPAAAFRASLVTAVYSHYRREEDPGMDSGKFDEELARMSRVIDLIRPGSLLLCNESFASTNEREGSHIARQILDALRDAGIRIYLVTHLYSLAAALAEHPEQAVFLRPERLDTTERTYRVVPGDPQPTSHGPDLYQRIFGDDNQQEHS